MKNKEIGLRDLFNVIDVANIRRDKHFAQKMKDLINEKIRIQISKEDYNYIMENYAKT